MHARLRNDKRAEIAVVPDQGQATESERVGITEPSCATFAAFPTGAATRMPECARRSPRCPTS